VLYSQPPQPPKISTFAPAPDLIEQVDFFIGRATDSLADPAEFQGANQSRLLKDSHTLAVLGLTLSAHDVSHALEGTAPALGKSAEGMGAGGMNYGAAKAALADVKAARGAADSGAASKESDPSKASDPSRATVKWEKCASLPLLMK